MQNELVERCIRDNGIDLPEEVRRWRMWRRRFQSIANAALAHNKRSMRYTLP